jgi:hypothetical protein
VTTLIACQFASIAGCGQGTDGIGGKSLNGAISAGKMTLSKAYSGPNTRLGYIRVQYWLLVLAIVGPSFQRKVAANCARVLKVIEIGLG